MADTPTDRGAHHAPEVFKLAPDSMIAGTVPLARGADPLTAAYHAAAFALDTERVRLMARAAGDRVHYLAAAASDFNSQAADRPTGTALGNILQRAQGRARDAMALALLEADDAGTTAVVLADGEVASFRGYSALIEEQLRERYPELEIVDVTQEPATTSWEGYQALQDRSARRVQRFSLLAAATVATLSLAGLALLSGLRGPGRQPAIAQANEALARAVGDGVQRANAPSLSASYTFFEVQRLASLAADSGGRIVKFVQDNNRIAWEVRLPLWVTQEMLAALGSDIRVRREANALVVRRGILERDDESTVAAQRADDAVARNVSAPAAMPPAAKGGAR
jgi:hypothetical protein